MMKRIFLFLILLGGMVAMKAQELPQVNVQNPQGKSVSSVSWIDHETPFVVSFWSTTCKPCLKELDTLSENYDDWNDEKAFRVIAVSIDDSRSLARAKALAAGRGWEMFDVYYDVNSDFKRAMNVSLVPHIFIFGKNGNQIYTHVGYKPGDEVELFKIIQGLK
jgi:thiol-disulfide isomerase/thioredoxin